MKVSVFILTLAMILSISGVWAAENRIKLENKLSVGDTIISERTAENFTWANFKKVGGPLFEQTGSIETTTIINVISVDENGVADIKVAGETSGSTEYSDREQTAFIPATKHPVQELKVTKSGEVLSPNIEQYKLNHPQNPFLDIDDWLMYIVRQQSPALTRLPDRRVGAGDVWTYETSIRGLNNVEMKVITRSRLFAFGKMDDYECAWIQSEAKLPLKIELTGNFTGYSSITIDGMFAWEGRSYFAYEEGRIIKDRNSWNFVVTVEIPMQEEIAVNFLTTRVISTSTSVLTKQ